MPIEIIKTQPLAYASKLGIIGSFLSTVYKNFKFKKMIDKFDLDNPPLFSSIEIETYNRCNNDCPFCPANKFVDIRKPEFMKEELFEKIVNDLSSLNYNGEIMLFHNNEPLLDNRLEKFVACISSKLPNTKIEIWTNGLLLTPKRLQSLYDAGLRFLLIDNYDDDMKIYPNVKKTITYAKNSGIEKNMTIKVWLRKKNAILTNRASLAPNKKTPNKFRAKYCLLPFTQFNVNPSGLVHICCNDVYYSNIVGDLNQQTILEVWRGEKLTSIRKELIQNGRVNLVPCRNCDL